MSARKMGTKSLMDFAQQGPKKMPSKFDLPIEFHIDQLQRLGQKGFLENLNLDAISARGSWMSSKSTVSRKSRFEFLRADFLMEQMKDRPSFEGIRDMALDMVQSGLDKTLCIIESLRICAIPENTDEEVPYNVFSWLHEHFLKRRKVPNVTWVSVLQRDYDEECLDILKFKSDLKCLRQFLDLIFAGFKCDDEDLNVEVHVVNFLDDTFQHLGILERLTTELEANKIVFHDKLNSLLSLKFSKGDSKQLEQKTALEEKLMVADVFDPIEKRYQLNYYSNKANQQQIKSDLVEDQYTREIERYKDLAQKEETRSENVLKKYQTEIEDFKSKIAIISNKYDTDFEAADNQLSYTRISIDKLTEQRAFLSEQIDRFREELEAMYAKDLEEEEKARLAKEAAEEMAAAELLKKSKKAKKGGKDKKPKKK